jgi:hypothetical protein
LSRTAHSGRAAKFSFSGLLRCGLCGSNLVISGGQGKFKSYCCSSYKDGGKAACTNSITVRKSIVQSRLLASIKDDLLTDAVVAEVARRVAQEIAKPAKSPGSTTRITERRAEAGNLTDAIASGLLRASPALGERSTPTSGCRLIAELCGSGGRIWSLYQPPARIADRSSEPNPLFALEKPWHGLLPEEIALIRASGLVRYQESATATHTRFREIVGHFAICITYVITISVPRRMAYGSSSQST